LDTLLESFNAAIEERPEVLKSVSVHIALQVALGMVDEIVLIAAPKFIVRFQRVRKHLRTRRDILANLVMQRSSARIADDLTESSISMPLAGRATQRLPHEA
jgi:hypothetical protein